MSRASKTGVRGLYRGADGLYRIDLRWRDPVTAVPQRYREKLPAKTSSAAAKRRAGEILRAALAGTFDPKREAPVTLRAAFDRYLAACEVARLKSTRSRRTHAKTICAFLGAAKPLADVAAFDVERLKSHLRAKTRTIAAKPARKAKDGTVLAAAKPARTVPTLPGTINRHLTTLKSFARWAGAEGLLDAGRVAELRAVRLLREPEGRVRWLSDDEQKAVNERLTGWLRPIVLVALGTGARRTEVAGLRWRDVDRAHAEIVLTRTKTGRTRHVPISPAVLAVIDAQPVGAPEDFVFAVPRRASRKPAAELRRSEEERRGDVVTKAWSAWCATHGLKDLHVHDLRHHAATMIRRAGHGLDVVAAVLGHSNIRTAQRYAHLGRADLVAAVGAASVSVAQPLPTAPKAKRRKRAKS